LSKKYLSTPTGRLLQAKKRRHTEKHVAGLGGRYNRQMFGAFVTMEPVTNLILVFNVSLYNAGINEN